MHQCLSNSRSLPLHTAWGPDFKPWQLPTCIVFMYSAKCCCWPGDTQKYIGRLCLRTWYKFSSKRHQHVFIDWQCLEEKQVSRLSLYWQNISLFCWQQANDLQHLIRFTFLKVVYQRLFFYVDYGSSLEILWGSREVTVSASTDKLHLPWSVAGWMRIMKLKDDYHCR